MKLKTLNEYNRTSFGLSSDDTKVMDKFHSYIISNKLASTKPKTLTDAYNHMGINQERKNNEDKLRDYIEGNDRLQYILANYVPIVDVKGVKLPRKNPAKAKGFMYYLLRNEYNLFLVNNFGGNAPHFVTYIGGSTYTNYLDNMSKNKFDE